MAFWNLERCETLRRSTLKHYEKGHFFVKSREEEKCLAKLQNICGLEVSLATPEPSGLVEVSSPSSSEACGFEVNFSTPDA